MMLSIRQKDILKATLTTVERDGLSGFTMKKVAGELGITDAALYKHFADKTEIFAALADVFREKTLQALLSIVESNEVSPLKKLEIFVKQRAHQFESEPGLTAVLFSEELFRGEPQVAAINLDTLEKHAQLLLELVVEAQSLREVRSDLPPIHVVLLLTGPIRLLVQGWKNDRMGTSLESRIAEFWTSFSKLVAGP